jgi:hypothetical protein
MHVYYCNIRPVLLRATDATDLMALLIGSQRTTDHIAFGAHQVVIVKDDLARQNLPEELKVECTTNTILYH